MNLVTEYRNQENTQSVARAISRLVTQPWTIMEICGGQTHAIVKFGLDQLLPSEITLVHGPGCPVCVTPVEKIDQAIELAMQPQIIMTSFGDMARVPGSQTSLLAVKARGAQLRIIYSPLDALKIAQDNPDKEVVFFGVGFETTAPATAAAIFQASQTGIHNFSVLVAHVLVPPAMHTILASPDCTIQGFLAAGHVCAIMGTDQYHSIASTYGIPVVVTGFEPLDILHGLFLCIQQLESQQAKVQNQYTRAVRESGNQHARMLLEEVFELVPRKWRGIGTIDQSGLGLSPAYAAYDAEKRFSFQTRIAKSQSIDQRPEAHCGQVLQGIIRPMACPHFSNGCTPEHPVGAPMVSSEGACAAYFKHRQYSRDESTDLTLKENLQ